MRRMDPRRTTIDMSDETPGEPLDEPEAMTPDELEGKCAHADTVLGAVFAGAVSACVLLGIFPTPLAGATGSARLEWRKRQTEIAATVRTLDEINTRENDASAKTD